MQIAIEKFTLNPSGYVFCYPRIMICRAILRKFFDLPRSVRIIWISLHDTPTAMRHKAEVFNYGRDRPCIQLVSATKYKSTRRWGYGKFHRLFKPLVGKTVYVQVEYEE